MILAGTNDVAFDADPTIDAVAAMADQAAQAGPRFAAMWHVLEPLLAADGVAMD